MQPVCLRCDAANVDELSGHPTEPATIEGVVVRANESHPAPWSSDALESADLAESSVFGGSELSAQNVGGKVVASWVEDGELRFKAELAPSLARPVIDGQADLFVRGRVTVESDRSGTERRVTTTNLSRVIVGDSRDAALSVHRPASTASLSASSSSDKDAFGVAALADVDELDADERATLQKQAVLRDKY